MGRKIEMRKIENTTRRQITFSKRKSSLLRKSNEISVLCDVDVALLTYSPSGRLNKFCNKDRIEDVIKSYINSSPTKRYYNTKNLKTKLEKLQMLDFIGDDANKLDYLNDRIKHLELQERRSKATLETVEAKFKEYEISSSMEPSLEQLLKCENNLKNSLQLVIDRKTELIKELIHPNEQSYDNKIHQMDMKIKSCDQQRESSFNQKEMNSKIQNSTGGQLLMQLDPQNNTNCLKLSERSFQDIINNGSMNNELGASKTFGIGPSYINYNSFKVNENVFQDTINGSMNQMGASTSTLQHPTYVPASISNIHESIFQDPVDGSMSQLGALNSTSNFLLPPAAAAAATTSPSIYQLRPPSPPSQQFQFSPPYTPMQGLFGHDASYGIPQQYSTPALGNHENNPNREDGGTSTFQLNINMGEVIEFNFNNHYPFQNPNADVPSTSQRFCSSMVSDPLFTTSNMGNDNGCFEATEEYPDNSDNFIDTSCFTADKWQL